MPVDHRPSLSVRGSKAIILALVAGAATSAQAQTLNWANPNGGTASTAANWSPAQVPGAGNPLIFNIASALATIPVTFNASSAASSGHTYRQESYTLTMSTLHTIGAAGLTVGDLAGDNAAVSLASGTIVCNGPGFIGDASGSTGALSVNDSSLSISLAGADLTVGNGGAGSLSIVGGGNVIVNDLLNLGANSTSVASLTVSGTDGTSPSSMSVQGTGQSSFGGGGDATVNVSALGRMFFDGGLVIARGAASTSTATVSGASNSFINVAGDLMIGRNIDAIAAAGVGTLNVNGAGASVSVDGTIFVAGDPNGGTGTLHMSTGHIDTTSLALGAGSTLDLDGGTLTINSGTLTNAGAASHLILGGASTPIVNLNNNAQGTLNNVSAGRLLTVGGGTAGTDKADLHINSGSDLGLAGSGDVVIGENLSDDGKLFVDGVGSTLTVPIVRAVTAGLNGSGRLDVNNNAQANIGFLYVARNAGAGGLAIIQVGADATSNAVFVGGTDAAAGGNGGLSVINGATLAVTSSLADGVVVWPQGDLSIRFNSSLTSDKPVRIAGGHMELNTGASGPATLNAPQLVLEAGSLFEVNPQTPAAGVTVNANTLITGLATIDMQGDLTIGNAASTAGFNGGGAGVTNLHGHTLTILDSNGSGVADVNLTSPGDPAGSFGTLNAANGIAFFPGRNLTGTGLITGNVTLQSPVSSVTMVDGGITFDGLLTNLSSAPISGTTITFPAGSGVGYTGTGTINARVNADVKTTITATGNLTMGTGVPTGCTIGGTLLCGSHLVTLIDSNGVTLGGKTEIVGGTLKNSINLGVAQKTIFQGRGTADTSLLSMNGNLRPGDTDAAGLDTGTIECTGDIQIGAQTNYLCHLGPPHIGEEFPRSDHLQTFQVGDSVQINGGTLDVKLLPGYTPQSSDKFDVVKGFAGVNGFFDTHILPPGARVSYLPNAVRVHFCYPDCDGDAALTIDDFICFQTEFALGVPDADCDGDAFLSIDDFICFQTFFAIGC